ncbi:hypothetical protein [Nesterenkonia sp. CL21]|nr:hypothetical protein [Nesterenkonia sp. CL21]MDS2172581.1 hypothetical protein [Nesterenkonia sp. CL21]
MSGRIFPRATGWRRVLWLALTTGGAMTVAAVLLALAVAGVDAGMSAALGGSMVLVLSAVSLVLVDVAERVMPSQAITAFMLGFALKLAVLAVVLSSVTAPGWVLPGWTVGAAAAVVIAWQSGEIAAFLRLRTPIDPESGRNGSG